MATNFRNGTPGSEVLRQVIEVCRAEGVLALHLDAERGNGPAQAVDRGRSFRDNDRPLLSLRRVGDSPFEEEWRQ
jgi:hypothetical protein